jgi:RecA-family ATPase
MPYDIETEADIAKFRPPTLGSKSVAELMRMTVTKSRTLIDDILPIPGVVAIIAPKKTGKTVLAAQMAMSIAANEPLWGEYRITESGPVLFIEQDDTNGVSSLKDFIERTPLPISDKPFRWVTPKPDEPLVLGADFISLLEAEIREHHLKAVFIDSYTALRAFRNGGHDIVKLEAGDFRSLDLLAQKMDVLIAVLHHISIGNSQNHWSDRAAGTFAIGQSTQAQIFLDRFRELEIDAPERLLRIEGRHIPTSARVLRFQKPTLDYCHVYEGGAAEHWPEIQALKRHFGERAFSPQAVCFATGVSRPTAHRLLSRLTMYKAIGRIGHGEYRLTEELRW